MSAPRDRSEFVAATVEWINGALVPNGVHITADTPLFAGGLINSIRVLELIAWTERAIGRRVPDASIRMDYFRTVRRIAEVFVSDAGTPAASGGADVAA